MNDYASELEIDPDALDVEWLNHPKLAMHYGELLAAAQTEMDMAKEDLDVIKAEIDRAIRDDPMPYTGEDKKPTEGAIQNIILLDKRVREATKRHIEAREQVALLKTATYAINDRKAALENLVRLHAQQWFAGPREPRNLSDEYSMNKRVDAKRRDRVADKVRSAASGAEVTERRRRRK